MLRNLKRNSYQKLLFLGCFFFVSTQISCKKEKSEIDLHLNYFPTTSGLYVVYDVQEIIHDKDLIPAHDTFYYQIKEVINEPFIDDDLDTAFKIKRYIKLDDTSSWQIKDIWWKKIKDLKYAIQFEENEAFIKLVFRPTSDKYWNGNTLNSLKEREYNYDNIHDQYSINGFSFDSTVTVIQEDFKTLVDYQDIYEVYAKDIGLIHKYSKDLVINNFDSLDISTGHEIYYQYLMHGID